MRLAIALVLAATAASAQSDPMEAQRCIWRCLADSQGADDPAYGACVQARCDAGNEAVPSAPWVYGDHPALGRGAFGQTARGVVGLACGASGPPLDLRLTDGLYGGPALTVFFDGSADAFSIGRAAGPASQYSADSCGVALDAFRTARALYLVDGAIAGVRADQSGFIYTLQGAGRSVEVRTGADAYRALGGSAIPLTGSGAAIDRLLAACPAARADAAQGCGD